MRKFALLFVTLIALSGCASDDVDNSTQPTPEPTATSTISQVHAGNNIVVSGTSKQPEYSAAMGWTPTNGSTSSTFYAK